MIAPNPWNPWKPTAAVVFSILVTGAAIVWRLAVLETHVEELRASSQLYVTQTQLRYELLLLEGRMKHEGNP
jgi:hypothetical protein